MANKDMANKATTHPLMTAVPTRPIIKRVVISDSSSFMVKLLDEGV
jgi:hypothetical protein